MERILLTGANTTSDNCTVTNSKYAIKFGANNCTVKNTLLIDNQYGIYAFKMTNQEIYGNQILNSYEGICLMSGNGTEIHDNVIKNSTAPHGSDIPTGIYLSDTGATSSTTTLSLITPDRRLFIKTGLIHGTQQRSAISGAITTERDITS